MKLNGNTYNSYKESGADWIGKIPSNWTIKRLKFLINEKNIRSETGSEELLSMSKFHGIIPRSKITERLESAGSLVGYKLCDFGDLVVNKLQAWNGMIDISKYDGIVSPDYSVYRFTNDSYDRKYCKYLFITEKYIQEFTKNSKGIGEGFFRLYNENLLRIYSILPPKPEQTAIANFLDDKTAKIDQAIAQKERLIELLQERKHIIIQNAVAKGLDPNVKMKDSGVEWIGDIPEHWDIKRIKYLFNLIINPAPNNNDFELLSIYTHIGVRPRKDLEQKGNRASTTDGYWKVEKGDFIVNKLLAWMGAIGISNYSGVTSPAYDILRPTNQVYGEYFHYFFRTKKCSGELKKYSRGIMEMRLRLYFDKFGMIFFPLPSTKEQKEIVDFINKNTSSINILIKKQEQIIAKLKEYKTTLIDHAVTGKIKVSELG